MRPSQLLGAVLAMSSVSTALSGAFDNIHGLGDVKNILMGRQDDNAKSSQAPSQAQSSGSKPTNSASPTKDQDDDKASSTKGPAPSGSQGTKTSGGKPSGGNHTSYDPRLPAGGISMVTPAALAGEQYYKVGDYITFAWNYTSLSVTPSFLDIMASCTANQATYTIAVNQSSSETSVVWDTKDTPSGQAPFLTEKYKLLIYDAESSVSAAPQPGYLAPFNMLTFGMYTPRPYVNLTDYTCANCIKNGALSHSERMTIQVLLFTSGTTVASLLYFAHNFGLF